MMNGTYAFNSRFCTRVDSYLDYVLQHIVENKAQKSC